MIVKYCGIQRQEDVAYVNLCHPDLAGFILVPDRKRYVTPEKVLALRAQLDPEIQVVGVFVNEKIEFVQELIYRGIIDMVQLHGQETEEYIRELKATTDAKIIKAFGICSEEDCERAEESSADMVLLDSPGGGTGETFNWSLLQKIKRPYILAGGLNCSNIEEAIRILHPYGVDVSSGIETDGRKDVKKMQDFMDLARKGQIV